MSILSGKTRCRRCTHDVANEDMAGNYCIDCLNAIEREKSRVMAECCAECRASDKPGLVYPIPFCEGGCPEIDRRLENEDESQTTT